MGVGSSTSKASGGASPPVPAGAGASSASAGAAAGADKGELGVVPQSSLDISYVTGRVLAAGRPSVRETLLDDHRNNVAEMAAFLGQKHSDAYLLLNLSNKNRTSIPYSKFDNRVVEFIPYSRPDLTDDTPCMGEVFRACYCLKFWLEWGAETTVVAVSQTRTRVTPSRSHQRATRCSCGLTAIAAERLLSAHCRACAAGLSLPAVRLPLPLSGRRQ